MAKLFDVEINIINYHLKEIFKSKELDENSVIRKFRITASDGKKYNTKFYNLDAIISVGYRVNSIRATQFRQWATQVLRKFAIKGYVLDKKRMENGSFLGEDYLSKSELESLGRIVNAYLELAEERAKRRIPMTMEDWAKRLDLFLEYDDRTILRNAGEISTKIAQNFAETEFEKYRIIQDNSFESDFDKIVKKIENDENKN